MVKKLGDLEGVEGDIEQLKIAVERISGVGVDNKGKTSEIGSRNTSVVITEGITAGTIGTMDEHKTRERVEDEGSNMKIMLINCQSIRNKVVQFSVMIDMYEPDVVIGVESWLKEDINNREIFPGGYDVYRRDRGDVRGGGVFIMVRDKFESRVLFTEDIVEMMGVRVELERGGGMDILGLYRVGNHEVLERLIERVREVENSERVLLIGGDLNLPEVNWNGCGVSIRSDQILVNKLIWEGDLWQTVSQPTRGDNKLDVMLLRPKDIWRSTETVEGMCDHKAVIMEVEIEGKRGRGGREKSIKMYNKAIPWKVGDFLRDRFKGWVVEGRNMDGLWQGFKDILEEGERLFVPTKRQRNGSDPIYYNSNIRKLKRKCREESRRIRLGLGNKAKRKEIGKELEMKKKEAKETYMKNLVGGTNSREGWRDMYKYLRTQRGGVNELPSMIGTDGEIITEDQEKADILSKLYEGVGTNGQIDQECFANELGDSHGERTRLFTFRDKDIYLKIKQMGKNKAGGLDNISGEMLKLGGWDIVPYLRIIFNVSINNGVLPNDWKEAVVIPIHKGGDKKKAENYRPISLTSTVCKIMEKLVVDYIGDECKEKDWIRSYQHGFRKGYSCESQLVALTQDLADVMDRGGQVDGVALDLSKAFDRVVHSRLMTKVRGIGMDIRVVKWVEMFLENRGQRVRVGEILSRRTEVQTGVPQGSILGPLLFLLYINDLPGMTNTKIRLFADDMFVYRLIRAKEDQVQLQVDLDRIEEWIIVNGMKVNAGKSQEISFYKGNKKNGWEYNIGDQPIQEKGFCKYLGVTIDSSLHWGRHIGTIVGMAYKTLYMVMRVFKECSREVKERAYLQLVRPLLEYCSSVWDPQQVYLEKELDGVQRKAARFVINNFKRTSSVSDMVSRLGWESLRERRMISREVGMFKAYIGEPAWMEVKDRMIQEGVYKGRKDHMHKVKLGHTERGVGRFSYVGKGIREWNGLGKKVFEPFPMNVKEFKKRVRDGMAKI